VSLITAIREGWTENQEVIHEFGTFREENAMFEAEVEMERRSSFLPMLLMVCLVAAILSMVTYVAFQVRTRTPLDAQQASHVVETVLQGPGAAVIHFHSGLVVSSVAEKPGDPNYRLLEKAGIVKLAKAPRGAELISVTPAGERLVTAIPGFKKWKEADGTFTYQVPLAQRQLVSITDIKMTAVNNATVQYTWKWVPNKMGDLFDAGGPTVKGFNLWDRQILINKYEADFYHGNPSRSTLALARADQGWRVSAE
jgi:hypothetical protein